MKKIVLFVIFTLLIIPTNAFAETRQVILDSCVQGDQIKFKDNEGFVTTYQLHSITSPSINHITKGEEPYSKEALDYTCSKLKNASSITLEEVETTALDHGEAYVFIDGNLLQEDLLKQGYAKISYLEEDNPYHEILVQAESIAQENKAGIWSIEEKKVENTLEETEEEKEEQTEKKKTPKNPILKFLNGILDSLVASINKMIDSILQKIDNML